MKEIETDILIIGAGPAGLAAAMELSKKDKDFIVVEKDNKVGGLSKTYSFKEGDLEFLTDNGPHRFFSKNKFLYDFIEDLINEKWITVERQTRQYIDGKFYDYPVNFMQALKNVGILKAFRMGFDYMVAKVKYKLLKKEIKNFEDYIVANFGRSLGEFNMINYTEKIWGIPASEIHPDWAKQRIKGLNLTSLILSTIKKKFGSNDSPKSLVDQFYYPETGTGLIYETIKTKIQEKGYKIFTSSYPKSIHHDGKRFRYSIISTPEGDIKIKFNKLIESIPITKFIKLVEPKVPDSIIKASSKLRHRNQIYLFVTLDKDSITKDQWIYFPEKSNPIGRVSEMKNFSKKMSPKGKTSLFLEFFCFEDDDVWEMNSSELLDLSLNHLGSDFFVKEEVRSHYSIKKEDVYPVYDLVYMEFLDEIKNYLDGFKNLYYIGRPGRFRYNNQDHSLEMGIMAANSILDDKNYDFDSIGAEKEYYEKGKIRRK